MINSSRIHPDELFGWVDDFVSITGLTTYAALQIYAECCYFQSPNNLLECLINIEKEYEEKLNEADDEEDINEEIFLEHYGEYQLDLEMLADEDQEKFSNHYRMVLIHHGFNRQFCVYFIKNFHPLSDYLTSNSPKIDKGFIFSSPYSYDPYFTEPPIAPSYRWLNIEERLDREPAIDSSAWIAVFKELGFTGIEGQAGPSWPAYEPSFFLEQNITEARNYCEENGIEYDENDIFPIFDSTAVYITPFIMTSQSIIHLDMMELRRKLQGEGDTIIVLYSAPYILRAPDNKSFISIWGEIFDGDEWKTMTLNNNSTSVEKIIESAFLPGSEPDWKTISTPEQPLVDIWQKHHRSSKKPSPGGDESEVIQFKPWNADD